MQKITIPSVDKTRSAIFATKLMATGKLSDKEVADIMGWSPEQVHSIRKVCVDDASLVVAVAERMAREL